MTFCYELRGAILVQAQIGVSQVGVGDHLVATTVRRKRNPSPRHLHRKRVL